MSTTDEEDLWRIENGLTPVKPLLTTLNAYKLLKNNLIITGPSGCGKSKAILNLLNRTNDFARIYIVANPYDTVWELFKEYTQKEFKDGVTFYKYVEDLPTCKNMKKHKGNTLVIIDDPIENPWDCCQPKDATQYVCDDDISVVMTMQTTAKKLCYIVKVMWNVYDFNEQLTPIRSCSVSK